MFLQTFDAFRLFVDGISWLAWEASETLCEDIKVLPAFHQCLSKTNRKKKKVNGSQITPLPNRDVCVDVGPHFCSGMMMMTARQAEMAKNDRCRHSVRTGERGWFGRSRKARKASQERSAVDE